MKNKRELAVIEEEFLQLFDTQPLPIGAMVELLLESASATDSVETGEWIKLVITTLQEQHDFVGLLQLFKALHQRFNLPLQSALLKSALLKASNERLTMEFVESAQFDVLELAESLRRLDLLLAVAPGVCVIDDAWGFGSVKSVDGLYKRIVVDFVSKPGHTMSFNTVCETLCLAPAEHILTRQHDTPEKVAEMSPGGVVKAVINSFGPMNIARLEAVLNQHNLIVDKTWKNFWESARKELRDDPFFEIPAKRSEPLQVLKEARAYNTTWLQSLAQCNIPSQVLSELQAFYTQTPLPGEGAEFLPVIKERFEFAIKAAHNIDTLLYTRLALLNFRTGMAPKLVVKHCEYLWQDGNYLKASVSLTIKELAGLVELLLSEGDIAAAGLLEALPEMPYNLLHEVLKALGIRAAERCHYLLAQSQTSPALIVWCLRYRTSETAPWLQATLFELLGHAIQIAEQRAAGENLRMKHQINQFFAQDGWLKSILFELDPEQRKQFFERVQGSLVWEPAARKVLLHRMIEADPDLETSLRVESSGIETQRLTSWRSLTLQQRRYKELVEVKIPDNARDIAVARSYGDLRENFEYQAAIELQRQLLQQQSELQSELANVRGSDFSGVIGDQVMPGTMVTLRLGNNTEVTYTILGEWDHDTQLGIISSQSGMAQALQGHVPGDRVVLPGTSATTEAEIKSVQPINSRIAEWIANTGQDQ